MRLAKLLVENQYEHQYFNLLAGLAFFGSMDFDNAKKYLTLAKETKEFDANGQRYLGHDRPSQLSRSCGKRNKPSARPRKRPTTCRR